MSQFLAHAVGDYVVQSDWMAAEKTKRSGPALLHAASYASWLRHGPDAGGCIECPCGVTVQIKDGQ